jgi:hypothetical protein
MIVDDLLSLIPEGWPTPPGWDKAVARAKEEEKVLSDKYSYLLEKYTSLVDRLREEGAR